VTPAAGAARYAENPGEGLERELHRLELRRGLLGGEMSLTLARLGCLRRALAAFEEAGPDGAARGPLTGD
jgi:hypothetical protein